MKKTKVIFATDENPLYFQFKKSISQAWENLGFEPVCVVVSKENYFVDPNIIPFGNQAQIIRVLYPSLFPDDKFIVSDIDMLPLNFDYFNNISKEILDNSIVNVSVDAYPQFQEKFPMCYYAGYGKIFSQITGVKTEEDIGRVMSLWYKQGHGWNTDEICFFQELKSAVINKQIQTRFFKRGWLQGLAVARIDRSLWNYNFEKLKNHQYIDSHLLRPFDQHINDLRPLFESVGVVI